MVKSHFAVWSSGQAEKVTVKILDPNQLLFRCVWSDHPLEVVTVTLIYSTVTAATCSSKVLWEFYFTVQF